MKLAAFTFISILLLSAPQHKPKVWEPDAAWMQRRDFGYVRPKDGYAGDAKTAIAIGTAAIEHVYGEAFVKDRRRYKAKLFGDVWVVYSYFEIVDAKGLVSTGGPTWAQVNKTTGAILNMDSER